MDRWPDGRDFNCRERLPQTEEGGFDFGGSAGNLDLEDTGRGPGPGGEGCQRHVDAAVLIAPGFEVADAFEDDGLVGEGEFDGVFVADEVGRALAEESLRRV